jgi:hypothetical protein
MWRGKVFDSMRRTREEEREKKKKEKEEGIVPGGCEQIKVEM